MGLWIPQCVEVGLALRDQGRRALLRTPLTGDELVEGAGATGAETGGPAGASPAGGGFAPEAPGETVIEVEGVEFSYPSTPGVLRGVDLKIRRGELLAMSVRTAREVHPGALPQRPPPPPPPARYRMGRPTRD